MRLKSNIKTKKGPRVNEKARINKSLFIFIVMKLIGLLKEETSKSRMMRLLKDMGFSKEDAEDELDEITHYVKTLPEKIKLYRILEVDSEDKINTKELGCHYSTSRKDLINSHTYVTGSGEECYIVTVMSPKSLVDVNETIANRILYPNEQEITLKNKGRGVEVVSVKKIKP